jgi:hypothetical protein
MATITADLPGVASPRVLQLVPWLARPRVQPTRLLRLPIRLATWRRHHINGKRVVVATRQKRLKRLRAELRMAEPREPSPEVEAFFARNVRPGGPLPPAPSHSKPK